MSVTTTANPTTYNLQTVLADYELHHSEEHSSARDHLEIHNPSEWPTNHRRIPPYRPVNTELDQTQRRVYLNGVERAFVAVMFTGVFVNANLARLWRKTGGRIWDIGYRIGGEW
ncbi:hypothetical protein K469DRAFT_735822 [Zopfia rhizophila CBS 207.26]|uniref:Uncharacterized protein n=1 Tax=Zopfia rhizophila CBS 207.26 TaxID=1314779 RepID=A0A6A6EL40_9PEZI|nr:hypothetical protein K469DRAFT_735822 [Zopfia rhizophila CBS 207.26]